MNHSAKTVDDLLREGLYLFSVGKVLEGRREWRQALTIEPEHAIIQDYLDSTDAELTEAERLREASADVVESAPEAESAVSEALGWGDDEVTSEVSGRWRRGKGEELEHTRVTPPGERPVPPEADWEIEADASWDASESPIEGEALVQVARSESGGDADAAWLSDTQSGGGAVDDAWVVDDSADAAEKGGGFQGDSVEGLLGRAVSAFHDGDLKAARAHLNALLALDPGNSAALSYLDQIDQQLKERLHGKAIPERTIGMDEVEDIKLNLVGGYVVSLIDGQTTVEDIYALSSHLDESEVTAIMVSLLEQGIIRLRER